MHSLNWKLAGALVLIVIVSVGLTALITNVTTRREFQQYVIQGNSMHSQGVAESLAGYYSRQQNWNGVQEILPGLLRMNSDRLIVSDDSGRIVGDTDQVAIGGSIEAQGLAGYGVPMDLAGRKIGSFYLIQSNANGMMGMMGMMGGRAIPVTLSNPESSFLTNVNRSFWFGGLIAAFAALLLGLILTRQITRPVRALTQGVRQIGKGDLSFRVAAKSKDELGELAQSFNLMAGNLAASENSRRRMTADIAHELRTPLTIIEGTVDGILDGVFQPDRERLTSIKEQTATLTRLIGDLRELSLAESGQLKLSVTLEDPVEVVRRKVEQAQLWAGEKQIHWQLDVEGLVPEISLDRLRIEQVMANLLTNAVRHTQQGGNITVSVRQSRDPAKNRHGIMVSVKDNGEGIAAEHLPHIFDRFYRVSDSRARNEGGTGLGLAIVKYLVEAHGGKVWVESEVGKGSSFFVFLPSVAK